MKRGLFRCNFLRSARLDFCATDVFSGTLIDFFFHDVHLNLDHRFSTYVGHFRKLLNSRVSFKMQFSMCLVNIEKEP